MIRAKYIIFESSFEGKHVIVFDGGISHDEMFRKLGQVKLISAGKLTIGLNEHREIEIDPICESVTLKVEYNEEQSKKDANTIRAYLEEH